jgi:hypothetical protein
LLKRVNSRHAYRQLRFKTLAPQRHGLYFSPNLPDLLLSILKNEQLFQFGIHAR